MLDEEKVAYIEANPSVRTVPIPAGWERIETMPTDKVCDFLLGDGSIYGGYRPSNAAFLTDGRLHIAWRPAQ